MYSLQGGSKYCVQDIQNVSSSLLANRGKINISYPCDINFRITSHLRDFSILVKTTYLDSCRPVIDTLKDFPPARPISFVGM